VAKPNLGHVERARRAPRLDASEFAKQLEVPNTSAFRALVAAAQSAVDDHHFWIGIDSTKHARDLHLLVQEKLCEPLESVRRDCLRMREIDVFRPLLEDSPLDRRVGAAIAACDSLLAHFSTDHLPEWMVNDAEALALNLKFPTRAAARRALAVAAASAFSRYASIDHRNWTEDRYKRKLYDFIGVVLKEARAPWPTDKSGRERLIPLHLRKPARE
jgi:hypothetical protein